MKKKETQCGTYRFLFQKNEANHDNVYITSNGPIFKEAGNLLKQIEIREKQKKKKKNFLIFATVLQSAPQGLKFPFLPHPKVHLASGSS